MYRGFAALLPFCLWLLMPPAGGARGETVYLTTGQDDPPFTDRNRPDGGMATRLVLSVFHRMGYRTQLDWLPWRRGYGLTRSGVYQASFPYLKTPERERDVLFSDVIFSDASYLWTRAGEMLDVEDLPGFKGKTVCVPQGFHSPLLIILSALIATGEVRVERPDTPEKCVQMLAARHVDALSGQEAEIALPIKANNLAGAVIHGPVPLMRLDFHVIFNRDNPGLARQFDQTLQKMKRDGSYALRMPD
jgi:polar amino acid transport system substrate-binding protein